MTEFLFPRRRLRWADSHRRDSGRIRAPGGFELRRQGLTPVYVGKEAKKSLEIKLPSFSGRKKRDVLFFTQELSTLLSAGVPVDRALSITAELTERARLSARWCWTFCAF